MATHTLVPQIYYADAWHTLPSGDVLYSEGVRVRRGVTEDGRPQPSKIEWRFNNAADTYRPTNPAGPLYGQVARNMPVAHAVDGSVRAAGEASEYRPGQTTDFRVSPARGLRWVDLTAEGIQRRIGQWTTPLRSAMFRQIRQYANLIGYWPLEDGRDASQLSNAYPSGRAGTINGADLNIDGGPAGAESVAKTSATSTLSGRFTPAPSTGGWQVSWTLKLPATPSAVTDVFTWRTSNGYVWRWRVDVDRFRILVTAGDVTLLDADVAWSATPPTSWLCYRVKVSMSTSTSVHVEAAWFGEDQRSWGFDWTFTGTTGALEAWTIAGSAALDGALYGHVFGVKTTADDLQSYNAAAAFNGYRGEYTTDRFLRLCGEESIPCAVLDPGEVPDIRMGPQRPAVFAELMREVADTCDGMLYDQRTGLGLVLRTGRDRYTRTPVLALTWPGQVAAPFDEVLDDQDVANLVTVKNAAGGEVTARRATGALSTQAPPNGVGEYKRTVDVNVAGEADLAQLAGWYLARGTLSGARYPRLTVDLDAHPDLTDAVNAVDVGDHITVAGRDPETLRLEVLAIEDTSRRHRRTVTFVCRRGDVHASVRRYNDAGARYDSGSTTLAAAQTVASSSWNITTADRADTWSTTALPYEWMVAGERVRVTGMTAPVASGGAWTQTATVVRAVNGVSKTQASGATVRLADPTRYAL